MNVGRKLGAGVVAAAMLTAVGLVIPRANAAADPNAYSTRETYIGSSDGVRLHTVVFRPAAAKATTRTPVILTVSPYATSGAQPLGPTDLANDATPRPDGFAIDGMVFAHGYSVVVVALRGYGASTGCFDEGGRGEQQDVKHAVEWAASQPWSTGKVGMVGHSYDAQTQLMALDTHPKGLAAIVPSAAPAGYMNFFTDGVSNVTGRGFGAFYLVSDLLPPSLEAPLPQQVNALNGPLSYPACYAATPVGTLSDRPDSPYWRARDLAAMSRGSTVPTLVVQGFDDFNVRSTNFTAFWSGLKGPKRAFLGPWDHSLHHTGRGMTDETLRWLDAFVKGDTAARRYEATAPPVEVQTLDGHYRVEQSWPPADVTARSTPILGGTYLDGGVNFSETGIPPYVSDAVGLSGSPVQLPAGIGSWTFTPPLAAATHIAGQTIARVHLRSVVPNTTLIALLYDVDHNGYAHFVARGAHLTRRAGNQTVSVTLYPNDWQFAAGDRVGLLLTGSDGLWLQTGTSGTPVRILGGSLVLPTLAHARTRFLAGGPYPILPQDPPFALAARVLANRTAG
jgi:uncharacterized protein